MAVTKQFITDLSSTFADVDEDRLLRLVEVMALQVPASKWGTKRDLGVAYLVMHEVALGDFQAGKGQVAKERMRDIETQYATPSLGKDGAGGYGLTVWGQKFLTLRKQIQVGPRVLGGC